MSVTLSKLGERLSALGYDVQYRFSGVLSLPQCTVYRTHEAFVVNVDTKEHYCFSEDETVEVIDKLGKFVKFKIRAECSVLILSTGDVDVIELLKQSDPLAFSIDTSTVTVISKEVSNGPES